MINNVNLHKQLPVYGGGMQIRDWIYDEDHCKAIDIEANGYLIGEVYKVGSHNERPHIFVVQTIIEQLNDRLHDEGISEALIKMKTAMVTISAMESIQARLELTLAGIRKHCLVSEL